MNAWSKVVAVTVAGCLVALTAALAANAAEITLVTSAGPLPDVMGTLLPMFETATGNKVKFSSKGEPALTADVKQGAADLVITNSEVVDALAHERRHCRQRQDAADDLEDRDCGEGRRAQAGR
jgi:ABC-type molybdate transport system substrate-binding protein